MGVDSQFNLGFVNRDVPGGTNIVMLYDEIDELIDILPLFFGSGIIDHETCLIIYPNNDIKEKIRNGLAEIINLKTFEKENKIKFIDYKDVYYENGKISQKKVFKILHREYGPEYNDVDGVRIAGDMSWMKEDEFRDVINVAKGLTEKIEEKKVLVLNTFPLSMVKPYEMIDLIQSYTIILYKKEGKWLLSETQDRKTQSTELERLEIFTKFAVDRELKIMELKEKIKKLEHKKTKKK